MPDFTVLFVLYPDSTQLDFAGPYEVFSRLPGVRVRIASPDGGDLRTEHGLTFKGIERLADVDRCDLICIPGGSDQRAIMTNDALDAVRRLAGDAGFVTSVCNGSLVLGAAALLAGKRATCHWAQREQLRDYGALPDGGRVVRDGNVITGAGVTSGIDFALAVAAIVADPVTAQLVQLVIEYAPDPPFDAGTPETASPEVMAAFDTLLAG
jgi:cyclohexyl-isocyanide hydratase